MNMALSQTENRPMAGDILGIDVKYSTYIQIWMYNIAVCNTDKCIRLILPTKIGVCLLQTSSAIRLAIYDKTFL